MRRTAMTWTLGATAAVALAWSGSALALSGGSYSPPGGQLPATAPGGTEGLAGPRNVEEAVGSGHAYPVAPPARYRVRRPPAGLAPHER